MKKHLALTAAGVALAALMLTFAAPTTAVAQGTPTMRIVLPERFRVLSHQLFDLRVEAVGLTNSTAQLHIIVNNGIRQDALQGMGAPEVTTDNDNDPTTTDKAWTFRRVSFGREGVRTLRAIITDGRNIYGAATQIGVQEFRLAGQKSIILFIGDAMGTAYRDAGRIVAQSTGNRFREGFFDELQQMDQMPVTGMVMTYALDQITPDSANTGTAWASGNKTIDGALNVFPDNNDFKYIGTNSTTQQATKQFALDNPRVETLWEYLKRLYGYKTGIVATSEITDATPAAEGGHTLARALQYDIARQYVDGVFAAGPTFDVIMGGAKERFDARTVANSGDTRNLVAELQGAGFTYVQNRAQLNALPGGSSAPNRLLGLFRTGNMNVAYDKLGLQRPADEPAPNFGGFTDQPFLDEMTEKAIATLSKGGGPFILMVEGASIDKQSHPNHANGQLWDTIEFDKAVGVARSYIGGGEDRRKSTLILVTADHDQSMSIIGAVDTAMPGAIPNVRSNTAYPASSAPPPAPAGGRNPGEAEGFPDYEDANGDRYPENLNQLKIAVGYRTGNHTGSSVPITAEGAGALLFFGYFDQTDVFFKMARVLSINTQQLDRALEKKLDADVPAFN
ncbi:MAG: alkaline phosphatase, partial [Pyrinomonadaceae bacterium]